MLYSKMDPVPVLILSTLIETWEPSVDQLVPRPELEQRPKSRGKRLTPRAWLLAIDGVGAACIGWTDCLAVPSGCR